MTTAQPVTIAWQVQVTEEYRLTLPADRLTVASLDQIVSFPEGDVDAIEEFLAEHEGGQQGSLVAEVVMRTVTDVQIGTPDE